MQKLSEEKKELMLGKVAAYSCYAIKQGCKRISSQRLRRKRMSSASSIVSTVLLESILLRSDVTMDVSGYHEHK
jgi:hypothetical protein